MNWDNPLVYIIPGLTALSGIIYLARWMGKMDYFEKDARTFMGETRTFMGDVRTFMGETRADIKGILKRLPSTMVEGESPLRLTALGKTTSETLAASSWAQKTANQLAPRVKGKHPYEIQEFCRDFVREEEFNPSEDLLKKMKDCAYNNAITIDEIEDVLAIELRDALLKMSPD